VDHDFIIATPDSLRLTAEWGYLGDAAPDLALFDDLLSCLSEQFQADTTRVYTTGFSAGALWTSYLVVNRAEYLTAAVILSGGVGMFFQYQTPAYRLPVLLAWGGPRDTFNGGLVRFNELTEAFRDALVAD
jgi:poly(3-hydroxybutyrate) depolymerase